MLETTLRSIADWYIVFILAFSIVASAMGRQIYRARHGITNPNMEILGSGEHLFRAFKVHRTFFPTSQLRKVTGVLFFLALASLLLNIALNHSSAKVYVSSSFATKSSR
jgi:hypothetical protein